MKRHLILAAAAVTLAQSVALHATVLTPEQRADPSTGQIPNSSPIAQEYYLGQIYAGQSITGTIVGQYYPQQGSVSWYKYVSNGTTPVTFDMFGTQMSYGNGFGASNDSDIALFDNSGNFVASNRGMAVPSTGDSNVAAVIPSGASAPPVTKLQHQPLDPGKPEADYHSSAWWNSNEQGLSALSFVSQPQSSPFLPNYNSSYTWNQYSILPAGTYFLAVTGAFTYWSGNPRDASQFSNDPNSSTYLYAGGDTATTPFGFLTYNPFSGTYQLNTRIAGDFDASGTANLADLRLLRLETAHFLPTQGIDMSGYQSGAWVGLSTDTSSPLTDLQQYDLTGNSRIDTYDIAAFGRYTGLSTAVHLTWNNTPAASDPYNPDSAGTGMVWDIQTSQNFNDTVGPDVYLDGDLVTFNDANNGNYAVTLNSVVQPGSVTVSNSAGNYVISGTGSINGSTGLLKTGTGKLTISTVNAYTGGTNVSGGTLALTVTGALPINTSLTIGSGALVQAVNHGTSAKVVLQISGLSIAGSTNSWTGKLDLANNDLIARGGSLAQLTNQVKMGMSPSGNWQGSGGITSSAAAADSKHLTALGVIQNSTNGSPTGTALYTTFDGATVANSDVLVKYTYYGDANLDGKVDGSDYSKIDSGFITHTTGWFNGDFNYDGIINGSDYTLIDNAYNTQGAVQAALNAGLRAGGTALLASTTAELATTSVPEPASLMFSIFPALALLRRRRFR